MVTGMNTSNRLDTDPPRTPLSFYIGGICLSAALIFSMISLQWSLLPLGLYVFISLAAPFFTGFSFFLPVITHGDRRQKAVALTFDDGPDPFTTPALLKLLESKQVLATFFLIGEKAYRYPDLVQRILSAGHDIGNHSFRHDPFLMLRSAKTLHREIRSTQDVLRFFGVRSYLFRPPAGITNPKLGTILSRLGMICVNYSCRGVDFGNRRTRHLARRILRTVRPGDIILLHDVVPAISSPRSAKDRHAEIERIIDDLQSRGLEIVPLTALIQRPVMLDIQPLTQQPDLLHGQEESV